MDYAKGVAHLADMALNQSGSGAKAAAEVLLSTYNSYNYHMPLVDLCNLDESGYQAAMTVIRCRAELMTEPHSVIDNGDAIFSRIENIWRPLQTQFRYADKYRDREIVRWKCPHCGSVTDDYVAGDFPGRIDGKPVCESWSDKHPEYEPAIMEQMQR